MNTEIFGQALQDLGYSVFSGVPCSFLKPLINHAVNNCNYIAATNEGDAVAICSGSHLGGKKAVVLFQNSGLGNAVSPLTSLNYIFKIPILGIVSLRGEDNLKDEPQHELMGKITTSLLTTMSITWEYLSDDIAIAIEQLRRADEYIKRNQTFFLVVKKGTLTPVELKKEIQGPRKPVVNVSPKKFKPETLKRLDVLKSLVQLRNKNTFLLATTGKTGRELYELEDSPNHFYQVGSMGCVSAIGLGLALACPNKEVIAIDGDGAALMRLGNMATNGYYAPRNLLHVLLDNHVHDSTGGQPTASPNMDFVSLAVSCGYSNAYYAHSLKELVDLVEQWRANQSLTFITLEIEPGSSSDLGRPNISPSEVALRFQHQVQEL